MIDLDRIVLERLEVGAATFGDIVAAVAVLAPTAAVGEVEKVCRSLAARSLARVSRVRVIGRKGDEGARLMWHLVDRTPPPLPAPRSRAWFSAPRRGRMPRKLDPHKNDRPEPIEILARMAGRSNFITPKATAASTATVPVTPLDIAHAIATAADKFGAMMAMAIACQRPQDYEKAEALGLPRVLAQLRAQRALPGIVKGPRKFLGRIAFQDAFEYLLAPTHRPTWAAGARRWKLRREIYRFLVEQACGVLEAAAATAAKDAVDFLFKHELSRFAHRGVRSTVVVSGGALKVIEGLAIEDFIAECKAAVGVPPLAYDLAELMAHLIARPRAPGVLTIANLHTSSDEGESK